MKNNIEIFKNEEFGEIRTIEVDDKVLFCGKDVAEALGYTNPNKAINDHCKEDGVTIRSLIDSLGRNQDAKFITEGNVYRLIARSKLPAAEKFERWLFDEVVPSIRKHGGYIAGQETLSDEQLLAKALLVAQNKIAEREAQLQEAKAKIIEDKPKVVFANAVASSDTTILIGELAKLLKQNGVDIGQNRLFSWMRENGYLIKRGESYNMPTQKSMELKLFEIKERTIANPDGSVRVTKTTKVTGFGQQYFVNLFLENETT